jgi:hypothetical protein
MNFVKLIIGKLLLLFKRKVKKVLSRLIFPAFNGS